MTSRNPLYDALMRMPPFLNSPLGSQSTLDDDVKLPSDSTDTISSVLWSPIANHLAAASWDGRVRVYDIAANGTGTGLCALTVTAPILSCDWSLDGSFYIAGAADANVYAMDMTSTEQAQIGTHEKPVSSVRVVDVPGCNGPIVASGSWDKTVKFWDVRQSAETPATTLTCKERVYSIDTNSKNKDAETKLLFIATAQQHIHIVDLRNPTEFLDTRDSTIDMQTTVIRAMPDGAGFGVATVGGKCAYTYLDDSKRYPLTRRDLLFKCHRTPTDQKDLTNVWSVNDMQFHPVNHDVIVTGGMDGSFIFWDIKKRSRKSRYGPVPGTSTSTDTNNKTSTTKSSMSISAITKSKNDKDNGGSKDKNKETVVAGITALAFNRDGSQLAYAIGYDWSQGCVKNSQTTETKILIHKVGGDDGK